jgi:hypothetical protein
MMGWATHLMTKPQHVHSQFISDHGDIDEERLLFA